MLCSQALTSVFPSLMRRRLRDQKMQKMERVREPATRFGEDPIPWRSFILLRRLLQHRIKKQLPRAGLDIDMCVDHHFFVFCSLMFNLSVETLVRCLILARWRRSAKDSMFTLRENFHILFGETLSTTMTTLLSSRRSSPPPCWS